MSQQENLDQQNLAPIVLLNQQNPNVEANQPEPLYDIISYKINVVDKKLLDMGDKWKNLLHMTLGHTSEISDELLRAIESNDPSKVIEELGDATFFNVGIIKYLDLWKEEHFNEIISSDHKLLNLGFDWKEKTPEDFDGNKYLQFIINLIQIQNGRIATVIKNMLIKDTPKYEGVVLTEEQIVKLLTDQLVNLNTLSYFMGHGFQQVRHSNAIKLGLRYKESFTAEESLNRDVEAESEALQETIKK